MFNIYLKLHSIYSVLYILRVPHFQDHVFPEPHIPDCSLNLLFLRPCMNPGLCAPSLWHIKGPGKRVIVGTTLRQSPKVTFQERLREQLPYVCSYTSESFECEPDDQNLRPLLPRTLQMISVREHRADPINKSPAEPLP